MSLQSTISKVSAVAAAGTLAAVMTAGAAVAAPTHQTAQAVRTVQAAQDTPNTPNNDQWSHYYKGWVVSPIGLLVRSGPSRAHRVIGSLHYGQVVWIECKVHGEWIDGNDRWYKLSNGWWAWASARYIANIGEAPRWC
jgi:uncharacterized protein YgiM (DUF1202 family)